MTSAAIVVGFEAGGLLALVAGGPIWLGVGYAAVGLVISLLRGRPVVVRRPRDDLPQLEGASPRPVQPAVRRPLPNPSWPAAGALPAGRPPTADDPSDATDRRTAPARETDAPEQAPLPATGTAPAPATDAREEAPPAAPATAPAPATDMPEQAPRAAPTTAAAPAPATDIPEQAPPAPAAAVVAPGEQAPRAPAAVAAGCSGRAPVPANAAGETPAIGYMLVARSDPHAKGSAERAGAGASIEALCDTRDLSLVTIARDVEGTRGDAQARPALRWALDQLAAGRAQTLVVARLAHLSDSAAGLSELLGWFDEHRRTLIAIDFRLDTSTEGGRLAASALVRVGGWEHERISERTRRGLEAARSRGAAGGQAAVADVPELQERIRRMRSDGMTLQGIADVLNAEGVPTLRGGARWRPSSVQSATGYRRPSSGKRLDLPPGTPPP